MPSGGGKEQSKFLSGIQLFLFYFSIQSLVRIYFQNLLRMATSQVALSSVLRRWGLLGGWQEAEPPSPSSVRPPFPSGPHAQMSPQPSQTDGQEVLRLQQGLGWLRPQHVWEERKKAYTCNISSTFRHVHTPTCVVCTCEFLDLKGGIAFMCVNYKEMALWCAWKRNSGV